MLRLPPLRVTTSDPSWGEAALAAGPAEQARGLARLSRPTRRHHATDSQIWEVCGEAPGPSHLQPADDRERLAIVDVHRGPRKIGYRSEGHGLRAYVRGGQRLVRPHVEVSLGGSKPWLIYLDDVDEKARELPEIRRDLLQEVVDLVLDQRARRLRQRRVAGGIERENYLNRIRIRERLLHLHAARLVRREAVAALQVRLPKEQARPPWRRRRGHGRAHKERHEMHPVERLRESRRVSLDVAKRLGDVRERRPAS
jgi:hypothetical protein